MRNQFITILFLFFIVSFAVTPVTAGDDSVTFSGMVISASVEHTVSASAQPAISLNQHLTLPRRVYNWFISLFGDGQPAPVITIDNPLGIQVSTTTLESPETILHVPTGTFVPGKYLVKVNGDLLTTFSWGVLALNPNKSIYLPGETATFSMAALNEEGHNLCAADLVLTVSSPSNESSSPEIISSRDCLGDNYTETPDYLSRIPVSEVGTYQLELLNRGSGDRLTDTFEVRASLPYSLERVGPTRINPIYPYTMKLVVTAHQTIQGTLTDVLPPEIISLNPPSWSVDLKSGEQAEYTYSFDAADKSPEFYLLGPATLAGLSESRRWQIAGDASPVVQGTNTSAETTTVTSHTVNLPASIQSGETLIAVFAYAVADGTASISWPGGWTQFFALENNSGGTEGFAGAWRKADGTEGSTITVTTGTTSTRSSHVSYRISGATDPTVTPPEAQTAQGNNGSPDPPSLTPTGGAKDYLWLAVGASSHGDTYTAYPTNYSNGIQIAGGTAGTAGASITGSAERGLNATSEDPGAYTHNQSTVAEWVAATVGVHPSGSSTITVSGNIYQESVSSPYEGTTDWSGCDGSTANVAISKNGATPVTTSCNATDGSFSTTVTAPSGANEDFTVFLDTAGGAQAALFTHNNDTTSSISGLTLYVDRIVIRSESTQSITNADINTYDASNDPDIPYSSNGTNASSDYETYPNQKILINSGDTYAPGGQVYIPKIHIKGTYSDNATLLQGSGTSSSCDDTIVNLRPLCIDSGTYTANSATFLYEGSSATLIQNATYNLLGVHPAANVTFTFMGGTTTVNDYISIGSGSPGTITAATNSTTLIITNNVEINDYATFIANASNPLTLGGDWYQSPQSSVFTHSNGTVIFNSSAGSEAIETNGTGTGRAFYDIQFNHSGGIWAIGTNLDVDHNFTVTDVSSLTISTDVAVEVNGTYSIANAETAATTWSSGSKLYLNSGTAYTIGSSAQSAETYVTLEVGANTDIRVWYTSATTFTINSTGSLYSQDHGNTNGDAYIWGDFHTAANDYWSYATDFDGSALGGASRQVDIRIDPAGAITVDSGDTLAVRGASANRTTVSRQGAANGYGFTVASGGTINFEYADFDYLDGPYGIDIQASTTVTNLSNTKFDNLVSSGTDAFITIVASVIGTGATTWTAVQFDNTGSGAECNVNRTGAGSSGYWDFDASTGTFDGEANDCASGTNEADPGMLRWDDSQSVPVGNSNMNFQGVNLQGISVD